MVLLAFKQSRFSPSVVFAQLSATVYPSSSDQEDKCLCAKSC